MLSSLGPTPSEFEFVKSELNRGIKMLTIIRAYQSFFVLFFKVSMVSRISSRLDKFSGTLEIRWGNAQNALEWYFISQSIWFFLFHWNNLKYFLKYTYVRTLVLFECTKVTKVYGSYYYSSEFIIINLSR